MVDREQNQEVMKLLSALADPTRLMIVQQLAGIAGIPVQVQVIAEFVGAKPSIISHHINILREAGLVKYRQCGQSRLYQINVPTLEKLQGVLQFVPTKQLREEIANEAK